MAKYTIIVFPSATSLRRNFVGVRDGLILTETGFIKYGIMTMTPMYYEMLEDRIDYENYGAIFRSDTQKNTGLFSGQIKNYDKEQLSMYVGFDNAASILNNVASILSHEVVLKDGCMIRIEDFNNILKIFSEAKSSKKIWFKVDFQDKLQGRMYLVRTQDVVE